MKRIFLLQLYMILALTTRAQDLRSGRHIFNYPVYLIQCTYDGSIINGATPEKIEANIIFAIRNIKGDDYIIQVSVFTSGKKTAEELNLKFYRNSSGNDIFFKISKSEYELNAERLQKRGSFTVGAATTLIKIRPGRKEPKDGYNIYSEFGNDFNIGVSAGWKVTPNRHLAVSHSIMGGLSFSSIKVTPYTTKDFLTSESTQGCVTFSLGYVFEYNKFQVTVFTGIDVMSGEVGRKWIYRNRPWLGLGFGYQIFRGDGEGKNNLAP